MGFLTAHCKITSFRQDKSKSPINVRALFSFSGSSIRVFRKPRMTVPYREILALDYLVNFCKDLLSSGLFHLSIVKYDSTAQPFHSGFELSVMRTHQAQTMTAVRAELRNCQTNRNDSLIFIK